MQKTKLGLSVGIVAALAYALGLFGGYVALIILVVYVLVKEEDSWLKYNVVKAIALSACIDLLVVVINLIPDFLNWISSIATVSQNYFEYDTASLVISIIVQIIQIIKTIFLVILAIMALGHNTFNVPVIDSLITKHNFFGGNPVQNVKPNQFSAQGQFNGQPGFNANVQAPQGQFQAQPGFNANVQAPQGQFQAQPGFNAQPNPQAPQQFVQGAQAPQGQFTPQGVNPSQPNGQQNVNQ